MNLIETLRTTQNLTDAELKELLETDRYDEELRTAADAVRREYYGTDVYIRGLIEFTNYCKNDCFYCGIRRSNRCAERYRLTKEDVLECCKEGYALGFRTFVLQGGEDPLYTPERIGALIRRIKGEFPHCALTLSVGEQPRQVYEDWFSAGADRYLLRHETANPDHYAHLHPPAQTLENRLRCLWDLKDIGYQAGCGFMVGSPGQTLEHIADDLLLLQKLQPHMVGIGPFIPQKDTPFGKQPQGSLELTTYLLSVIRLLLPHVLLPATTALGTIHPKGRELGLQAGANVCMPNLSPLAVRKQYALYDNKICTGDEAAECLACLGRRIASVGCQMSMARGDHPFSERKHSYVQP